MDKGLQGCDSNSDIGILWSGDRMRREKLNDPSGIVGEGVDIVRLVLLLPFTPLLVIMGLLLVLIDWLVWRINGNQKMLNRMHRYD